MIQTSALKRSFIALPGILVAGAAFAQDPTPSDGGDSSRIEEIIVTATRRSAVIQDVPFSVAALSGEDLSRAGSGNLEELSRDVAGMSVQNLGPGQSQVAIRGVSAGQIVRDQPGVKEQVGIYMDESVVSLSLYTPDFDLFDLDRVEVLRGPQGTLFGAGSVGGTIRYITNQPEFDRVYGLVEADLNSVADGGAGGHFKAMANLGISGSAALRVVGYATEYAGFIDALSENGARFDDVNSGARSGIRASLLWRASDRVSVTPRVLHQRVDTDGYNREEVYNLFANPYTTTRPAIRLGEREQYLIVDEAFEDETTLFDLTVRGEYEFFNLSSVSSVMRRDLLASRDSSALGSSVNVDLGFPDEAVLFPFNLRDTTGLEQFTQEAHLSSASDSPLEWLVGVFYSDLRRDYAQHLPTPGYDAYADAHFGAPVSDASRNGFPNRDHPFVSSLPYDISQVAVFGEFNYAVNEQLDLTIGGRWYDWEEERSLRTGGIFSNQDLQTDDTAASGFSPRFLANYRVNDRMSWNAQASRGFRLGGVNDPLNLPLCTAEDQATFGRFQVYDDESIWNYETGFKSNWGNGSRLNMAVFHSRIEDLQVTLDAGSCSSRISFNVEEAHSTGVEFELRTEPAAGLELGLAGSFIEARFGSTVRAESGAVLGGVEEGNRLASVPELQLAATLNYAFRVNMFGGGDAYFHAAVQHVGDRITQPSDQVAGAGNFVHGLPYAGQTGAEVTRIDLELNPYTLLNLRFGIIRNDWETAIYLNNATDKNAALSFDRERGGRARLGFRVNQPRTLGIVVRKSFG